MEELIAEVGRLREKLAILEAAQNIQAAKDRDLAKQKARVADLTAQLSSCEERFQAERRIASKLSSERHALQRELAQKSASLSQVKRELEEKTIELEAFKADFQREAGRKTEESEQLTRHVESLLSADNKVVSSIAASVAGYRTKALLLEREVESATGSVCRAHEAARLGATQEAMSLLSGLRREALGVMMSAQEETGITAAVLSVFPIITNLLFSSKSPARQAQMEALLIMARATERPNAADWKRALMVLSNMMRSITEAQRIIMDRIPDALVED
jgi:hypothetical protein